MDEIKELLTTRQYTSLRQKLAEMNEADVAILLENLPEEEMLKVFRILPKDLAADVFPTWKWTISSSSLPPCRKRMRQVLSTT